MELRPALPLKCRAHRILRIDIYFTQGTRANYTYQEKGDAMNKLFAASAAVYFSFFMNVTYGQWMETATYRAVALSVSGSNLFTSMRWGGVFGVCRSMDNGTSWSFAGLQGSIKAFGFIGNAIIAGTDDDSYLLFRSTDDCASWNYGAIPGANFNTFITKGDTLFTGVTISVFFSADSGISWKPAWIRVGLLGVGAVSSLAVSGNNLFAGTTRGVFLTTDNGTSWTAVNTGLTDTIVNALVVSGGNLFAGTMGGGVFLSTNLGNSWSAVNTGLTDATVNALAVSNGNIYAGTQLNGVFRSTDTGLSWTAVNTGLTSMRIGALAAGNGYLFALAYAFANFDSGNIWRRPLSDFPSALPLDQREYHMRPKIYFSSSNGMLIWRINSPMFVQVSIYTISGEQVAILEQRIQSPGEHRIRFDGSTLPAGLYVYRFKAGTYEENSRFILTKK